MVHVCAPAEFGGLERVVQGLSQGLANIGLDVSVIAVVEPGTPLTTFFEPMKASGVRTVKLEISRRGYLRERYEVGRLLDTIRPDVLHTHGHRPDLLHPGRARRRGVAAVTTLHGFSKLGGYSGMLEWIQQKSLRRFDGIIAVSRPLARGLASQGLPAERVHCVPNACDPPDLMLSRSAARKQMGIAEDHTAIGWVGRLAPIKGADVFLRGLAELAQCDSTKWVAYIIGDGPERANLENLARSEGIDDRVRFLGAVSDAGGLLHAFDLYVLSSRSEGTPMALLEAMSVGVSVIATAVGGVSDVLAHGNEGLLVPTESPVALAHAIRNSLSDPSAASSRAKAGQVRVKSDFGTKQWIRRHVEVYRNAIQARRR